MGNNALSRKWRRAARRQFGAETSRREWAKTFEKENPKTVLLCDEAMEKMSEVLQNFAEPLLSVAESPENTKSALLVAVAAWNYSLLDEASKAEPDSPYSQLLADPGTRQVFEFLLERKRQFYPNNRRVILDFQLIPNGAEFQFNVISTLPRGALEPRAAD